MEPLLVNVEEAARLLQVGRAAVYKLVREQKLPHVRIGNQIRFTPDALREAVARGEKGRLPEQETA